MKTTSKVLYKTLILFLVILSVYIVASCTTGEPIPTKVPTPITATTFIPEPSPAIIPPLALDSSALQLWGNGEAAVMMMTRLGIGSVNSLAISPDGKVIAVGSVIGILLYHFDTLEEIIRVTFDEMVQIVVWSPNGNYLAVVSGAKVYVIDAQTGAQEFLFSGHIENVNSVSWSPDGQMLASLSIDQGEIHAIIWDSQTGKLVSELEFGNRAKNIHWMPDGNNLAIGPMGAMIILWDIKTGKWSPLWQDEDLFSYVTKVSWSSDATKLLTGGELGKVFVWDFSSDSQLPVYNNDGVTAVDAVTWSTNNAFVAAGFRDSSIIVWEAQTGRQIQKLRRKQSNTTDTVLDLEWSPDGKNLISLSRYEPITIWNIQTGDEVRSTGEHTSWILSSAWSSDGTKLATGSEDGEIILWDPKTGKKLQSFRDPAGWVTSLSWSPDGKQLASGNVRVTLWNALSGEQIRVLLGHTHQVTDIAWSPDGRLFASGSYGGQAIVWNASTGEQLMTLKDPDGEMFHVRDIAWSPHGDLLGVSYSLSLNPMSLVSQVGFWNPKTGEQIFMQRGIEDIVWHPVENIAASIYDRETVILWFTSTGQEICQLDGDTNVTDVAWSPDGKLLITSYADGSMVIIDAQTCIQLHVIRGHTDVITSVAWSPRGDLIGSTSHDGTVVFWGIDSP